MIQPLVNIAVDGARNVMERLGQMQGGASAAGALANAAPFGVQAAYAPGQAENTKSFAQVLSDVAGTTVGKLQNAEELSMRKMSGEDVPIRNVVDSVMEAEQALSTAVAIRDRIVQSYLEVSRMQI